MTVGGMGFIPERLLMMMMMVMILLGRPGAGHPGPGLDMPDKSLPEDQHLAGDGPARLKVNSGVTACHFNLEGGLEGVTYCLVNLEGGLKAHHNVQ